MGPGFRYHVITIVAIFMALGVGMVIGSSHLQGALAERLRVQLAELSQRFTNEVQPLRKENEEKTHVISVLLTRLTRNALKDVSVAIVVTGDYGDAAQRAADSLKNAGATVTGTVIIPPSFPARLELALPALLPDLRARSRDAEADGPTLVFRALARWIAGGGMPEDLARFTKTKLIETYGEFRRPAQTIVLIGGARDEADRRWTSVDYPLIEQLGAIEVPVVGAEPTDAVQSYIRAYQAKGISTVDNVETEIGGACLVQLVKGDRGSYGVKGTARDGLFPLGTVSE